MTLFNRERLPGIAFAAARRCTPCSIEHIAARRIMDSFNQARISKCHPSVTSRALFWAQGIAVSLSLSATSKRGNSDAALPCFTERDAALHLRGGYFQASPASAYAGLEY